MIYVDVCGGYLFVSSSQTVTLKGHHNHFYVDDDKPLINRQNLPTNFE